MLGDEFGVCELIFLISYINEFSGIGKFASEPTAGC